MMNEYSDVVSVGDRVYSDMQGMMTVTKVETEDGMETVLTCTVDRHPGMKVLISPDHIVVMDKAS